MLTVRSFIVAIVTGALLFSAVGAAAARTSPAAGPDPAEAGRVPASLTLRDAVRISLRNNPQLKQARVSYLAAVSGLASARDLVDTSVFAGISQASVGGGAGETAAAAGARLEWQSRAGDALSASVVPAASSGATSNLRLQYRRPLSRQGGGLSPANVSVVSAELALALQENAFWLARQEAAEAAVRAYLNAVRARDLIKVSQADVEIAQETVRMARRRLEEGLVAEIELSRAEIRLAQSRDALVERQRAYRDALDALLLAMGLPVGQETDLVDTAFAERIQPDARKLVEEALAARRDLKAQQIAIRRQELDYRVAGDDLRPSLDVVASYTRAGLGLAGGGDFQSQSYWAGGLEYSLPLGAVGRRERREIALRNLEQLKVDEAFLRERITAEVLAAVRRLEAVAATLDIYSANLKVAQDNLELARRMVEEGLVTNRDILEAQVALTQTRSSLLSAEIDYFLAQIALERAVGRDLAERLGS